MDTARYVVALICWIAFPPAILYWYILHPFVGFWRRVGKTLTFTVLGILFVATAVLLYLIREPFLATEYGSTPWLWVPGVALYVSAAVIERHVKKHLKFRILAGSPELDEGGDGGRLLTEGVYSRVRHPRYVNAMLGMAGAALFANYLWIYLLVPVVGLGLAGIVRLEERELARRFGEEYERYRARVPMFFPRRRSAA